MRPETTHRKASRIELEAFNHIQSYLIDPHDDGVDDNGNTTVHQLMRYEPNCAYFSDQLSDFPHHLFMLNKYGQTPLDIAIQETIEAVDLEEQMRASKKHEKAKSAASDVENATEKTQFLIERMIKYGPDCSIKFVKKPHRLDLKFEKSFAMAVKKGKNDVLDLFPMQSIKTTYVSVHQLKDYKTFKEEKASDKELLTTPLHLACKNSNIDAVRILLEL